MVHVDGHIEVAGSVCPVPLGLLNSSVRVRWDRQLVRVYRDEVLQIVHPRIAAGLLAPRPGGNCHETTSTQKAFASHLMGRCARVGDDLLEWATGAIEARGVRAYRTIQGVLHLTRSYPREQILAAARLALTHRLFRRRDVVRFVESAAKRTAVVITREHEHIRSMDSYKLENFL